MVARSRVVDRAAGVLLLAGGFADFAGGIMFAIRGGESEMAEELFPNWGSGAASLAFVGTERGLFMAGMVLSALGFCLLDGRRTARQPTCSCGSAWPVTSPAASSALWPRHSNSHLRPCTRCSSCT
jgi:hypothetical protein